MKLTKDGVDVCEVGYVLREGVHTEEYQGMLGKLAGHQIVEQIYSVECKAPVKFSGGQYCLVDEGKVDAPIHPFGHETDEGQDAFGKKTYVMQFTAMWPKDWR